jgi:hypothetical protein
MRRFYLGLITGIVIGVILGAASLALAYTPIKLLINGNSIQCDVPPQIIDGRVLVPARFVAEALGATVSWDDANQTVIINSSSTTPQSPANGTVNKQAVTIEDLPLDITIQKPDSIGNVYMTAKYKNNSTKNIVGFQISVLLKDKNEKVYLSNYDTVLPGETSPNFETFGPKSQSKSDIEFLKYSITIANNDGSKTNITYDPKLNTYDRN